MTELRGSGQGQGQGMAAEGPSMGRATSGSLLRRLGLKKPKDRSVSLWLVTEHGCKSAAPAQCLYVSVYRCASVQTVALSALTARPKLRGPSAYRNQVTVKWPKRCPVCASLSVRCSFGLPPQEAPFMIAEKRIFFFLSVRCAQQSAVIDMCFVNNAHDGMQAAANC